MALALLLASVEPDAQAPRESGSSTGSADGHTVERGWQQIRDAKGVTVFRRRNNGLAEKLAIGELDAPPAVVRAAVNDVEAKVGKMPYMVEVKLLKRDARGMLVYNRTSPPFFADRDYTIRIVDEEQRNAAGELVYLSRYFASNDEGPEPRKGVVRVHVTQGYWMLEPIDGGTRTRATYYVAADPELALPDWVDAMATRDVLSQIFEALRTRAREPKYRAR